MVSLLCFGEDVGGMERMFSLIALECLIRGDFGEDVGAVERMILVKVLWSAWFVAFFIRCVFGDLFDLIRCGRVLGARSETISI